MPLHYACLPALAPFEITRAASPRLSAVRRQGSQGDQIAAQAEAVAPGRRHRVRRAPGVTNVPPVFLGVVLGGAPLHTIDLGLGQVGAWKNVAQQEISEFCEIAVTMGCPNEGKVKSFRFGRN